MSLLGGPTKPLYCLGVVLRYAFTLPVPLSERELVVGVTLTSSPAVSFCSLG